MEMRGTNKVFPETRFDLGFVGCCELGNVNLFCHSGSAVQAGTAVQAGAAVRQEQLCGRSSCAAGATVRQEQLCGRSRYAGWSRDDHID